jgi:hypothetical protein
MPGLESNIAHDQDSARGFCISVTEFTAYDFAVRTFTFRERILDAMHGTSSTRPHQDLEVLQSVRVSSTRTDREVST